MFTFEKKELGTMDVRGPTPNHHLKSNDLSPPQSETIRWDSSERVISGNGLPGSLAAERQRAPEVVRLVSRLRDIPAVREDVVARVEEELRAGKYFTRESAEKTAESLQRAANETA
jgi:hypothetical protein